MITQLDIQSWSKELVTGNAQFLEISSTIYVVSQVRADNTFAVLKSRPAPPYPGPGYVFDTSSAYNFPVYNPTTIGVGDGVTKQFTWAGSGKNAFVSGKFQPYTVSGTTLTFAVAPPVGAIVQTGDNNTSFDPVCAYDGSRYIFIVGTQDNASGEGTDVLLFVYDIEGETTSPPAPLWAPITLATASYIRDSYDISPIYGGNQFVAVAVTNPSQIWNTPTVVPLSGTDSINISSGVMTVVAPNSYQAGQLVTFSGLQNAFFLNNVSVTVEGSSGSQFTASGFTAAEFWSVPAVAPYTVTVNNASNFVSDSKVIYTASSALLTNVTSTNIFSLAQVAAASGGTTTYTGTFPANLPSGTATITGFTNSANNGVFNVVSSTTTTLVVSNSNGVAETHSATATILAAGQYVLANGTYTFSPKDAGYKLTIYYAYAQEDYTQSGYENGFVTWLPGHSLLGFELDMLSLTLSPPESPFISLSVLDTSPFRYGNTFGAVSVCSPTESVDIEVYYESHPKQVTYTVHIFNLNLTTYSSSPPQWTQPQTLKTFTGRYADSRLTVIPQGISRTLLQQYYSQQVHNNALVGNLLLGYLNPTGSPPTWTFHVQPGSTAVSYIQGTLSVSQTQGAFVSYIASPVYDIRGVWSPEVKSYDVDDKLSYNNIDYIPLTPVVYAYKGIWSGGNTSYSVGDVVKVALSTLPVTYAFYTAQKAVNFSNVVPNLDTVNWTATLTPDLDSRFQVAPTAWPLHTNTLDVTTFNMTDVPGFYNNLNFTWLRGSKTVLDDLSKWGVVGERVGGTNGATYVSYFNAPPIASLTPSGSIIAYRGTPLLFDGSASTDEDQDPIHFTWSFSPANSNVSLTPNGAQASLMVNRGIGGASKEFTVGMVTVDYNGATPIHPPMTITNVGFTAGTASITTNAPVSLAVGETAFLFNIGTATFLNDREVTITSAGGSSFTATVDDIKTTELWTVPTTSPYTITVLNAGQFAADAGVIYSSTKQPLNTVPFPVYSLTDSRGVVAGGKTTYDVANLPSGSFVGATATITGFSNAGNNGTFPVISNTTTSITVSNPNGVFETKSASVSFFGATDYTQSDGTYTFTRLDAGASVLVTYTYHFAHSDYADAVDTGSAIANKQFQFCDVTIAPNAAPTIDFTHDGNTGLPVTLPIQALRNTIVTITPTYTGVTDPDDATTYSWSQTSGTPIPASQLLSGLNKSYLQFEDNGVLVEGDTLVWSLTVNDGVNPPVSGSVTVDVVEYPFSFPDTLRLSRSNWDGDIAQRNTVQSWSALDVSAIYTNLSNIKRTSILDGTDRYILISSGSVCVYGGINPNMVLLRKLFPPADNTLTPPANYQVMDAVHTEDDVTLVLDSSGKLYRFSSSPLINSDNPDTTIDLSGLTEMAFNRVFTTFSFGNIRVVILTGQDGAMLLQLRNTDLSIEGALQLTVNGGLLYGIDNVQFVRTSNVESLSKGKVLIGTIAPVVANITNIAIATNVVTVDAINTFKANDVIKFADLIHAAFLNGVTTSIVSATSTQFVVSYDHTDYPSTAETTGTATTGGKTYETLIDLSHGQIIGTWDASKLKNQFVATGEILFEQNDTYSGRPKAPYLNPIPTGTAVPSNPGYVNLTITWTADRPDLIQSYDLESSLDGVNWISSTVNSGFIESVTIPEPIGQFFYFQVKAYSIDGASPYSNIQTISTGGATPTPVTPSGFAILFGAGFGTS